MKTLINKIAVALLVVATGCQAAAPAAGQTTITPPPAAQEAVPQVSWLRTQLQNGRAWIGKMISRDAQTPLKPTDTPAAEPIVAAASGPAQPAATGAPAPTMPNQALPKPTVGTDVSAEILPAAKGAPRATRPTPGESAKPTERRLWAHAKDLGGAFVESVRRLYTNIVGDNLGASFAGAGAALAAYNSASSIVGNGSTASKVATGAALAIGAAAAHHFAKLPATSTTSADLAGLKAELAAMRKAQARAQARRIAQAKARREEAARWAQSPWAKKEQGQFYFEIQGETRSIACDLLASFHKNNQANLNAINTKNLSKVNYKKLSPQADHFALKFTFADGTEVRLDVA